MLQIEDFAVILTFHKLSFFSFSLTVEHGSEDMETLPNGLTFITSVSNYCLLRQTLGL